MAMFNSYVSHYQRVTTVNDGIMGLYWKMKLYIAGIRGIEWEVSSGADYQRVYENHWRYRCSWCFSHIQLQYNFHGFCPTRIPGSHLYPFREAKVPSIEQDLNQGLGWTVQVDFADGVLKKWEDMNGMECHKIAWMSWNISWSSRMNVISLRIVHVMFDTTLTLFMGQLPAVYL